MTKIVDLQQVRRNLEWSGNAKLVHPILDRLEAADETNKKIELFSAACSFADLIEEGAIRNSRAAWWLLRGSAGSSLPYDEIDRTISAGLFRSRKRRKGTQRKP